MYEFMKAFAGLKTVTSCFKSVSFVFGPWEPFYFVESAKLLKWGKISRVLNFAVDVI